MAPPPTRWHVITESSYPWEQEALEFVRDRLPDQEPYHAWTNFEFIAEDGSVNEVDLLVLAPGGFFLVEIKSRPGVLDGDAHTWIWRDLGREIPVDNPLLLANRKAKRLISLLKRQRAVSKLHLPFLEPLVFCSAPGLKVKLQGTAAAGLRVRDSEVPGDATGEAPGIVETLTRPLSMSPSAVRLDTTSVRAIIRAIDQAGIRRSQRARRIGDYELGDLLYDGPTFQDYEATHVAVRSALRRVRVYQIPRGASADQRRTIVRAAQREFQILEGISHPVILRAVDYKDHERGPALVFEHRRDALRLDHFLRQYGPRLGPDERLALLRDLVEAVKYAHDKRLVHRALSPQSILVATSRHLALPWNATSGRQQVVRHREARAARCQARGRPMANYNPEVRNSSVPDIRVDPIVADPGSELAGSRPRSAGAWRRVVLTRPARSRTI